MEKQKTTGEIEDVMGLKMQIDTDIEVGGGKYTGTGR